jgi:hypothetical protein
MPRRSLLGRLAAVAMLTLSGLVAAALTAAAGGPTSVLLASPDNSKAVALYVSSADYQTLSSLLGPTDAGETSTNIFEDPRASGAHVNVTWLIHDVSVWRVDRIFLDASGGPWIATQEVMDGGDVGQALDAQAAWHRPTDAKQLGSLLGRLGLTTPSTEAAAPAVRPTAPTPAPSAAVPERDAGSEEPTTDALLGSFEPPAGWPASAAVLGAIAGSLLTIAALRHTSHRASRPESGRDPHTA